MGTLKRYEPSAEIDWLRAEVGDLIMEIPGTSVYRVTGKYHREPSKEDGFGLMRGLEVRHIYDGQQTEFRWRDGAEGHGPRICYAFPVEVEADYAPASTDNPGGVGAQIHYLKGDATNPMSKGQKMIVHICNDAGKWGKGFVMALSQKWKHLRREYLDLYKKGEIRLGFVFFSDVNHHITVANMVAQEGIRTGSSGPPIRYGYLENCLDAVASYILCHLQNHGKTHSVHMPRIGCGLAGGKWEKVEPLIQAALVDKGIDVYVYDYET